MELLLEHLGRGFVDSLIITMPIVLTAAGIGLVVGILQAVTQVQEQTIAAAPKIIAVFLVIMLMGSFFIRMLTEYFIESTDLAFKVIPRQDDYILPPEDDSRGFTFDAKKLFGGKKANIKDLMKTPGHMPLEEHKFKQTITKVTPSSKASANFMETQKLNGK